MVYTKADLWYMSNTEWEDLKGSCYDADYFEWPDLMPESFSKEKAWADVEKCCTLFNHTEDYMWDHSNQFGSYGEYAEWLEHQRDTEEETKRSEEFFEYHHLLELFNELPSNFLQ